MTLQYYLDSLHCSSYNITMLDWLNQRECEETEIILFQEWLPRMNRENRAYLKGALQALLYVQESHYSQSDEE